MNPTEHTRNELAALSGLLAAADSKGRPYAVPEGYFEQFPARLLQRITGTAADTVHAPADDTDVVSPLLAGIGRKMPFSVPAGYFEQPVSRVPVLPDGLEKILPYQVPAGYFDALPGRLLAMVTGRPVTVPAPAGSGNQGGARIVSFRRNWMRYAAAAVLMAAIATGGWLFVHKQNTTGGFTIDNQEAVARLQQELNQLSDEAILEYNQLPAAGDMPANALAVNDDNLSAADIHLLLEDISDSALQDFLNLEQTGKGNLLYN